jgi:serine/threonine protein kinase
MKHPPAFWTSPGDLLNALRTVGLISRRRAARLARRWRKGLPEEVDACLRHLVARGVLTDYQARLIREGNLRQLRLGPYRILDHLGSGGMGEVYKAEHRLMGRTVALKVVSLKDPADTPCPVGRAPEVSSPSGEESAIATPREYGRRDEAALVAGFRREIRAHARLSHPHVVAAYDAARARGTLFLVLEYVEGVNLEQLVTRAGPLPVAFACEAVHQAALALAHLHGQGLLHRDVKPANLLLACPPEACVESMIWRDPRKDRPHVKLLDMGLTRSLVAPLRGPSLEGTLDFLAPERAQGSAPLDVRGDLYSLGCTLYYLLAGQVPFPGGTWTAKLLRHQFETPESLSALRPDVPAPVLALVERLMARSPEDRFPSPRAAAGALGEVVEFPPPAPLPAREEPSAPEPERPRRNFYALAAGLVFLAVLGGGLAAGGKHWFTSAPGGTDAVAPAPAEPPARVACSFSLEGKPGRFASLADAIAAAEDGDTILVCGTGAVPTPPVRWRGKALTLRAAPGCRPCLEYQPDKGSPSGWWQALLTTDRPLTLEGIGLRLAGGWKGPAGPLVCVEGGSLTVRDGVLTHPEDSPALVVRRGSALALERCTLEVGELACSVEVGGPSCEVHLRETKVRTRSPGGAALSLWAGASAGPVATRVLLEGAACEAGRIFSLRGLAAPVEVKATDSHFSFRKALVHCTGYPASEGWRGALRWQGRGNRFEGTASWLLLDRGPFPVHDLASWQRLWAGTGLP